MKEFINENGDIYNSFIYRWFDEKLKKYYIGSHIGNINDGYLFGGIDIKKEYKKRPTDFKREILSYHLVDNYKDIREIEKVYLLRYDVENDIFYYNRTNESYGGYHKKSVDDRLNDIDDNGLNAFQRASKKMVKTRMENNSYKTAKIKEYITKIDKMDDIKSKISKTLSGSRWISKDGVSKYIKKHECDEYLKNGWTYGISQNITYNECKQIAIDNDIKSVKEWSLLSKRENLPFNPDRKFKDEWVDWMDFLGKSKVEYKTYNDCKKIALENNINSAKKWKILSKNDESLPFNPDRKFKDEWVDWMDFLGKK